MILVFYGFKQSDNTVFLGVNKHTFYVERKSCHSCHHFKNQLVDNTLLFQKDLFISFTRWTFSTLTAMESSFLKRKNQSIAILVWVSRYLYLLHYQLQLHHCFKCTPAIPENKWWKPKSILIGMNTYNITQRTLYFHSNRLRFIAIKKSQFILRNHGKRCSIDTFRVMSSGSLVRRSMFINLQKWCNKLPMIQCPSLNTRTESAMKRNWFLSLKNQSIKRVKRDIYTLNGWKSTVYR